MLKFWYGIMTGMLISSIVFVCYTKSVENKMSIEVTKMFQRLESSLVLVKENPKNIDALIAATRKAKDQQEK